MNIDKLKKLGVPDFVIENFKKQDITKLNPAQIKALKSGLLDGKNMLVCTPTGSGKTAIATFAITKRLAENKGKAVYLVPLKALANEKYKDYKELFEGTAFEVVISTGDLDSRAEWLGKYDLLILTVEKMDSLIRHHCPWLSLIEIVIVDEIHLLNSPGRGPTLEILITILRKLLKKVQIIGLSACVHGDELICLADGKILPIREIVEDGFKKNKSKRDRDNPNFRYVNLNSPINIIGIDKNLSLKELKIEKLWKIKNSCSLIKIQTQKGKELKVTPNSRLLVLKQTGLQWTNAFDVTENDYIVTAEELPYPNFKRIKFLELIENIPLIYILDVNSVFRKLVKNLNPNLNLHQLAFHYNVPYSTFYHYLTNGAIPFNFLIKLSKKANIDIEGNIQKIKKLGGKSIKIPKTINHDFLRFLGMIAGDGYIRKQKCFNKKEVFTFTIKFTNDDSGIIKEYKRLVLKLFGIRPSHSIDRGYPTIIFSSRVVGDLLIKSGLAYGRKSHIIKLSPIICSAGKKEINGFISGLFDCDANVYVKKDKTGYVRYYSTSYIIIKQLQLILLRFDICSSVTIAHSNRKNPVYKLAIADKESLINFKKDIGFKSKKKQQSLEDIEFKTPSRKNLIPNLSNLFRIIRTKAHLKMSEISKIIKNYYRYERGKNTPSKKVLQKYILLLEKNEIIKETEEFGLLKKIAFSNISLERIKKKAVIGNKEEYVYDFTVEDSNYLVSGIISHNTIGNPKELAEWLKANLVIDNWRPVKLHKGICLEEEVEFY